MPERSTAAVNAWRYVLYAVLFVAVHMTVVGISVNGHRFGLYAAGERIAYRVEMHWAP